MGGWGGWEPGADWSMGRKGAWGGWESGAEGSLGRNGVWGGREPSRGGPTDRRGFQPALAPNLLKARPSRTPLTAFKLRSPRSLAHLPSMRAGRFATLSTGRCCQRKSFFGFQVVAPTPLKPTAPKPTAAEVSLRRKLLQPALACAGRVCAGRAGAAGIPPPPVSLSHTRAHKQMYNAECVA